MHTVLKRLSLVALAAVTSFVMSGCSSTSSTPASAPVTQHDWSKSADGVAVATPVAGNSVTATSPSGAGASGASLTKQLPASVIVNEDYIVQLVVKAHNDLESVMVTDEIPEGSSYVSSEPAAARNGNGLTWNLGSMTAGSTKAIAVRLKPVREGQIASCATITAVNKVCAGTVAGRPVIGIEKSGPELALLGDKINYTIVVKNSGTALARDVVVTDTVPAGLTHESGQKVLTMPVGDLAAGASKTLSVQLTAAERGRFCNVAKVTTGNAGEATDDACTVVQRQGLEVAKTGTKEQFVNKQASYDIVVKNTGDTALRNVVVTDTLPTDVKLVSVDGGQVNGGTITWNEASLPAGATKSYKVVLVSTMGGEKCNKVSVASAEGLRADSQACTMWVGVPALLLEVIDTVDPLLPGEGTDYVIRITNQGTAPDLNVKFTAAFPVEVSPVSGTGSSAVTVNGKNVSVAAIASLAPKQVVEWTISAKADQPGDARLKVGMTSDMLKTPVLEEESTHVY